MEKRHERPSVGGISIRSTNGAPSRKGCVVDGQMTEASKQQMGTPAGPSPARLFVLRLAHLACCFVASSASKWSMLVVNLFIVSFANCRLQNVDCFMPGVRC